MKKVLSSKTWSGIAIVFVGIMLLALVALGVRFYTGFEFLTQQTVFLDGEYSVDGGAWKPINNDEDLEERFHNVTFRGKISSLPFEVFDSINISAKNVWYTVKTTDGKEIFSHRYTSLDDITKDMYDALYDGLPEDDPSIPDMDTFRENYGPDPNFAMNMPNTPGNSFYTAYISDLKEMGIDSDTDLILEVVNPYSFSELEFSNCFRVTFSEANGAYLQLFYEVLPTILFFILVCFFGIFLFPVAGFILGKINYKYVAFGALCFFWGLFAINQKISYFLNLWIFDSTVCLVIDVTLNYFLIIFVLFYLKSNLVRSITRAIANALTTVYIILVVAALTLHFMNIIDMRGSTPYMFIYTALCTVITTILLFVEAKYNNRQAVVFLISWTPLTISIICDAVNHYTHFTHIDFYNFGLAVTMIYQIISLVIDLRRQYKEQIRYQQIQKELYEAKVSVMVSQIQPHFMYNALTSIAMMCSIDPETAQEATVTFAKYLRGNMDSLKQTRPVPFEQELEHLKKYLYIEKLRFGKKLNIEYDIEATDFVLPLLSIQPLVENAVKHGVGMKKQGGTVTIATRETDTAFEVIISDDGVGFDTAAERKDDGRSHVGMENTHRRLQDMCGGDVIIESKIGEGTTARVVLPKEGQNNENTVS